MMTMIEIVVTMTETMIVIIMIKMMEKILVIHSILLAEAMPIGATY